MTYLSKFELFGCFNIIGEIVNTLMIYQILWDIWILREYLNAMLLRYDEDIKNLFFYVLYVCKCVCVE